MRKLLAFAVILNLIALPAYSAEDEAAKKAEHRKKVEEKKKELNGSEWEVSLVSSSDPKIKAENDVLTFQNGQVTSKVFAAKDFKPTNYTITVEEGNENTVWETMQTSPKEGVVFVRGEWNGDTMRGIISQQLEGGNTRDFSFATVKKTAVAPETKKAEPAPEPVPAAPVEESSSVSDIATDAAVDAAIDPAGEGEFVAASDDTAAKAEEKPAPAEKKKKRSLF